jgi:hypothetical protein
MIRPLVIQSKFVEKCNSMVVHCPLGDGRSHDATMANCCNAIAELPVPLPALYDLTVLEQAWCNYPHSQKDNFLTIETLGRLASCGTQ